MSYQLLYICLFLSVTLCDLTDSRHQRNSHTSPSTVPHNETHLDHSWKSTLREIQNITAIKDKVELKVYYETLCPASVRFFVKELRPAVEKLASHLDVELIPYGHARTYNIRGYYMFRCQHGPAECQGNKLHACAIDILRNNTQAVLFNACLMQYSAYRSNFGFDYSSVLYWCGYKLKVHIYGIWDCVNSERGSRLLKKYGEDTHALRPQYVPYLLLDSSTDKQDEAGESLMATVCRMLQPSPPACHT